MSVPQKRKRRNESAATRVAVHKTVVEGIPVLAENFHTQSHKARTGGNMRYRSSSSRRQAGRLGIGSGANPATTQGMRDMLLGLCFGKKTGVSTGVSAHRYIIKGIIGVSDVDRLKQRIALSDTQMAAYLGTSVATLQRKRAKNATVSFVEGDRIYRLARILAQASALFREEEAAAEWLKSPQLGLDGAIPFELIGTEAGAREVEDLLGRIEYGVIS